MLPFRKMLLLFVIAMVPLGLGCQAHSEARDEPGAPSDDHDHLHEHSHDIPAHRPRDFGAAAAAVRKLHNFVIEELDEGHADHAHEAIDHLIDIARWFPEIAADSDLPEAQWNAVNADAQALRREYTSLERSIRKHPASIDRQPLAGLEAIIQRLEKLAEGGDWNKPYR